MTPREQVELAGGMLGRNVLSDERRHDIGSGDHGPKAEERNVAKELSTPFPRSADIGALHRQPLQQLAKWSAYHANAIIRAAASPKTETSPTACYRYYVLASSTRVYVCTVSPSLRPSLWQYLVRVVYKLRYDDNLLPLPPSINHTLCRRSACLGE